MISRLLILMSVSCTTTQVVEPKAMPPDLSQLLADSRYVGFFDNDRLGKTFPAVLDLVVRAGQTNDWQLQGVIQIYTGVTANHSSFYRQISLQGNQLTFAGNDRRDVRIVDGARWQQQSIEAFAVVYGFGQGRLFLQRQPVAESQLTATSRYPLAIDNFSASYHPFPAQVFGDQGQATNPLSRSKQLLQQNLLTNFDYDNFERLRVYYGILHHERHNTFQFVRINFLPDKVSGKITAIITLFFAEPQRKEFIVYQHNFVEPRVIDGNGEMFIRVDSWDKARLSGVWYSKKYGRIGRLFFIRERFPRLQQGARLIPALAGQRDGDRYSIKLQVENRLSEKPEIIFPAQVTGTIVDKNDNKNYAINQTSYDFYHGVVKITAEFGSLEYSIFAEGTDSALAGSQQSE